MKFKYLSIPVNVGTIPLGGKFPIRIQSMTNTDTLNTRASVQQCIRIIEAGADFVRLTAQGVREAENLAEIKKELRQAGFDTPLIADIHFNPQAAETAARLVEKVRINPGNYVDKRASFSRNELSESEYNEELERIHSRLQPLIKICHENKTVIRIGINHGSLSDRIMTRYGNTPEGMVYSALEFIRIFRSENFNDLVLSMKSSDTSVMIEATRKIAFMMQNEGYCFPLHLGVTEAGEGEDGRVRSAAGIGALLSEGLGDTIRVSLSEDPEYEIPVARKLAAYYPKDLSAGSPDEPLRFKSPVRKPELLKRIQGPLVITDLGSCSDLNAVALSNAGYKTAPETGNAIRTDGSADLIIVKDIPAGHSENIPIVIPYTKWIDHSGSGGIYPLFTSEEFYQSKRRSQELNIIRTGPEFKPEHLKNSDPSTTLVIFSFNPAKERYAGDVFLNELQKNSLEANIVLNPSFSENNLEDLQVKASSLLGKYVNDKRVSGIFISNSGKIHTSELTALSFSILQCTGTRITRTMYLSCPTCGRTKFNLQDAVRKVKEATGDLKGLKIAVMGCIVNGPGEMAGADYGYVGAAEGKVHIYRGTEPVKKNVSEESAVEELLNIIKNDQASL